MMDDTPLPTPPRSPLPFYNDTEIKLEYDDFFNNFDDNNDETVLDDLFSMLQSSEEFKLTQQSGGSGRKRKISELFSVDIDELFGEGPLPHLSPSPTSFLSYPSNIDNLFNTSLLSPPPTNPPSPSQTPHTSPTSTPVKIKEEYPFFPETKRKKLDSFSSSTYIKEEDLFNFSLLDSDDEEPPLPLLVDVEHVKNAIQNDHNYCSSGNEQVLIHGVEVVDKLINFDKIPKKTKILVPLKSLMETLQQKQFLVSPLGPGKKVIRLTNGDSVKGVLQSTSLITVQKPNHNVRKRPHSVLLTKTTPTEDTESIPTQTTPTPTIPSTKKKTKAHNNMERMRRIDLRNSFDNLKKLVPVLAKSPKCSKVEILKRAEEYVRGLRVIEKKLVKEEGLLRVRMQQLRLQVEGGC